MDEKEDVNFNQLMDRLREIANLVQEKDLNLEKSLDLLEEGIELANKCTERVDQIGVNEVVQFEEEEV